MPRAFTNARDRRLVGGRIRRVRLAAGLRQWELAEMVGTSQPSICMYERGVLPDPLRLLRIARIGRTSIEWLLTGAHCEGGSDEMELPAAPLYDLAAAFLRAGEAERQHLDGALTVIRDAIASLERSIGVRLDQAGIVAVAEALRVLSPDERRALTVALAARRGAEAALMRRGIGHMASSSWVSDPPPLEPDEEQASGRAAPARGGRIRAAGARRVRGHLFRVDPGLLPLGELLRDRRSREELERFLERMALELEGRRQAARA